MNFFSHSNAARIPGGGEVDAENGPERPNPGRHKTIKECAHDHLLWDAVFTGRSSTTGGTSVK